MKKLLAFLLVLLPVVAFGQSASIITMARSELQKRGLDETEVRARLMENGIDVDRISPEDYPTFQGRVTEILNKMQQEKAGAKANADSTKFKSVATVKAGRTTKQEAEAETGLYAKKNAKAAKKTTNVSKKKASTSKDKDKEEVFRLFPDDDEFYDDEDWEDEDWEDEEEEDENSKIYGHSLFTENSFDVFRTTDGAQAPETYVLGEGDEVHISIFGSSQTEIHQRIGADGSIQPAGSGKIFLKGMTLEKAREAIRQKLAAHYSFTPDQIAVSVATARVVQVSIYGEVELQGGFTVSALNTAFNALSAAGGPTEIGSVRNILLSRGSKNSKLDLYAYMMKPDVRAQYDLQNGDVMYVPVAEKVVNIQGAVNRPMSYEMIQGEGLADLITYAGGLKFNAAEFVQIKRHENGEFKYLEFDLDNVITGKQQVDLYNGDTISIRQANKPMENYVSIEGGVYYAGNYDLGKNGSLKALLDNSKPTYSAKTEYVLVERMKPDSTIEVLTVPFYEDFQLQARDKVVVLDQYTYRDVDTISVNGAVRLPFARPFSQKDKITVSQAIDLAGGTKVNGYPVAYIFRKDQIVPGQMHYIAVNLETDGDKMLQAGDSLNVYDNSTYTNVGTVSVSGAVKNPFKITFDESMSLHDLLIMAGGMTWGAAYDRVEVFRANISKTKEVDIEMLTLAVDDDLYPTNKDFQLQPFDHVVVRMTPNFSGGRTVEVNGRVKYPGTYVLEDSRTQLWKIIQMAGGLLDDADPNAYVFRTENKRGAIGVDLALAKSNKGDLKSDPILMNGDVININRLENTVIIRETGTRMAQFVPDEFSAAQKLVVYQGSHSAKWYIRHYAGGFDRYADRNSVTVTFPNNKSESTAQVLGFIRKYPTVEPGGVITLQINEKKKAKKEAPKEKGAFSQSLNSTITTITSVVSLAILAKQLK